MSSAAGPSNIFSDISRAISQEIVQTLLTDSNIRIERIVSHGHASPEGFWYEQNESEWVILVQGAARLKFENEESLEMIAGSFVHIPAHRRHRVEWTDAKVPTIWLAIFY